MKYCLSKNKLFELVNFQILKKTCTDDELKKIVELAQTWDVEILVLNYLLGIVLLSLKKKAPTSDVLETLEKVFQLGEYLYLSMDTLDEDFIHYLIKFKSDPNIESAEELREFQEDYNHYLYDRKIRY